MGRAGNVQQAARIKPYHNRRRVMLMAGCQIHPAQASVRGERVFHQKFGMGDVKSVEGDKLEIAFDRAGRKKVVASFVEKMNKT